MNVSTETLRRWDRNGKFKGLRHPINNYRIYPESSLLSLVEELKISYKTKSLFENNYPNYFQTQLGELYKQDAIEFLKNLTGESVDLIFADPPYNIKKAEWDTFPSQKEYVEWSIKWIKEAQRVLKKDGSLYICGFSEILADIKWAAAPLFKGCK